MADIRQRGYRDWRNSSLCWILSKLGGCWEVQDLFPRKGNPTSRPPDEEIKTWPGVTVTNGYTIWKEKMFTLAALAQQSIERPGKSRDRWRRWIPAIHLGRANTSAKRKNSKMKMFNLYPQRRLSWRGKVLSYRRPSTNLILNPKKALSSRPAGGKPRRILGHLTMRSLPHSLSTSQHEGLFSCENTALVSERDRWGIRQVVWIDGQEVMDEKSLTLRRIRS